MKTDSGMRERKKDDGEECRNAGEEIPKKRNAYGKVPRENRRMNREKI